MKSGKMGVIMDKGVNIGIFAGIAGAVLGSMLWIVILGLAIRSTLLIILPIIISGLTIPVAARLYTAYPERKLSISGLITAWLVGWNLALLNLNYKNIPQSFGLITTGKESCSLVQINLMLGIFFIIGCILIAVDIIKLKSKDRT